MRVTEQAHAAVRAVVRAGERAIDATVGNGHDTQFLAQLVGSGGRVIGFDVQEEALENARRRLRGAGIEDERVQLVLGGHEGMAESVGAPVTAVMFNLGYLPGGDHGVTTRRETTVRALDEAWALLGEGGVISVVCYRGHPGGSEEAEAVCAWAAGVDGAEIEVRGTEETESGPFLVVVRKG